MPLATEVRFVLTRALPLGLLLTCVGLLVGVYGTHGPEPFTLVAMLLAPGAFVLPDVTGHLVGDDRFTFWVFVAFQLAYYHALLRVGAALFRATPD